MNDMSFPSVGDADEFGGLDHLVLPGQDPAVLRGIHAALIAQLEPNNFVERMWVRDAAILAARAEYVRLAECALHRIVQDETSSAAPPGAPDDDDNDAGGQAAAHKIGQAYAAKFELFEAINNLEVLLLRERDRVINQYDGRTGIVRQLSDLLREMEIANAEDGE